MKRKYMFFLLFTVFLSLNLNAAEVGLDSGMSNPGYHDKPLWFKDSFLDMREDVAEASSANKRVILYFYQDGCPYCAKLLNDNFANREISIKTQKSFEVIAINMWGDREVTDLLGKATTEKHFAESLKVQYTPTLLMMDEDGKVLLRINGYFAPHKFSLALDYVAGKHEKQMDFREYFARAAPVGASGKLHNLPEALSKPLRLKDDRRESYRPLLVLFEQQVCKACDELHQEILNHPLVTHALTNLDVAIVDMWSSEEMQTPDGRTLPMKGWAKELKINYSPSLVFFDSKGMEVFRAEAYLRTFHIHGAIDYVVSGAYQAQPNFQRFLQHRTDVLHARGIEVDLMH